MATLLIPAPARASGITLPPEAAEGLRLIYNGEPDAAIPLFRKVFADKLKKKPKE